ncbi:ATP-binding protein [Roseiconus lacunae]|uniref:ATP-binding protein n=1 Tax=Roseiconus lacunae TaxID=2605694 RepID=UPI001E4C2AF8|nr:ATP-binding protein [Roseiconus lacunae]MCD0459121.1 ATP-binding protein [Roseiconus lacunae]
MAKQEDSTDAPPELTFKVAPHAIEDLGSNLYTGFPKVLAEFVANAYDADANRVDIEFDFSKARSLRSAMRKNYEAEIAEASDPSKVVPLADRHLPEMVSVEITDDGFGMEPDEMNERFLWAARKRRHFAPIAREKVSRPLMGRKGLGKLAGFGIASVMEVISKRKGDERSLKVTLDYDEILKQESLHEVPVESEWDVGTFSRHESGTKIVLRRLSFDATKSRDKTIVGELAEHFEFTDPKDFEIYLNGDRVPRPNRQFAYAHPEPKVSNKHLIKTTLETDVGKISFSYRIRFRGDKEALPADRRGVRVYAKNRMAAAPSLLNADTNMHGFRMTDYMDGVVQADFIDDQKQDYIATDRQSLKWDTPLLSPLQEFLSGEIKEACKAYQAVRDEQKKVEVLEDKFTNDILEKSELSKRELRFTKKIAVQLARFSKKGVDDPNYREVLPQIVRAVGHGELYSHLTQIAEMESPNLRQLIAEVVRLNRSELDGSLSIIRSRLKAIEALRKATQQTPKDGGSRNEGEVQALFETAPWLMDPIYHDFMTADKSMSTTLQNLAKHLGIESPVIPDTIAGTLAREADFAFLLGTRPLQTVLIVELKATNKAADSEDIMQLRRYLKTAREWLDENHHPHVSVRGELICTPPSKKSKSRSHQGFWVQAADITPADNYRVRSYTEVLEETEIAHASILEIAEKSDREESDREESDND